MSGVRFFDTNIYKISYWDSLIVAAAERAMCESIVTEDLNTGQLYHGMVAVNPFSESSSLL